jgi:MFS family permease
MPPASPPLALPVPPNQFDLLRQRRFAPFFWTQFLGAGNDNLFKFAFTVMVSYGAANMQGLGLAPALVVQLISALFILPFLLFSATSGQLADKYEKSGLMRLVKNLEIAIMLLAAWGFLAGNVALLLACTFAMGLHSTLFGPVKFAYLPQHLKENELTGGNGMVEMGTFVSILIGNLAGGLLVGAGASAPALVAASCIALALLGRIAVQGVPHSPASAPELRINWNPLSETWKNIVLARANPLVFRCLIGISWLWFFGVSFLTQFPSLARDVLHGNEQVASALLVVFSLGIGSGSLLCESLSRRRVGAGLVPLGALGMTLFSVDLYFASHGLATASTGLQGLGEFLTGPQGTQHGRVLADLFLLALFAGLYSVPLYALIQARSPASHRARIIAANNILNALFMIAAAGLAAGLLSAGMHVPQVLLVTGLLNIVAVVGSLWLAPGFLPRRPGTRGD